MTHQKRQEALSPEVIVFYQDTLELLSSSGVPFLLGGAYALGHYTGIGRHTKDLDVFLRATDIERALDVLERGGFRAELTFSHWLGKAHMGAEFIDLIFSSANGIAVVDDAWFEHAVEGEVFGCRVYLCPAEEMIWSKGFIMERERYDGADVAHILRARAEHLDWSRLLQRFGIHWRVLLSHLTLFGFIYPAERDKIPDWVMHELLHRLQTELTSTPPQERVTQGTILSAQQYLIDIDHWGYRDGRLEPNGNMKPDETQSWTEALKEQNEG
jgi:hypothetical protein